MRPMSVLSAACALLMAGAATAQPPPPPAPPAMPGRPVGMHPAVMAVTSAAVADGAILPDRHTQKAGPTAPSPALAWTGAPAGTQSFVLLMHDPDVIFGKGTSDNLHWLAYNIPATVTSLPEGVAREGQLPDGTIQVMNRGTFGYTPPGAPPGVYHHYIFEVWALDAKLPPLGPTATREDVLKAMDGHVLDKGTLVARFHR